MELEHRFRGRKVAVLYGGESKERAVSLQTGEAIAGALASQGYAVERFDWSASRVAELAGRELSAAFIALHGGAGENGELQGLLEVLRVPYTGSGVLASALCMDKARTKLLASGSRIRTAEWSVLSRGEAQVQLSAGGLTEPFEAPYVVKPSADGSSVGISIVREGGAAAYASAVRRALEGRGEVLVERFVEGSEISIAVLEGQALGSCMIQPAQDAGFYSYEAKYQRRDTQYLVPPPLDEAVVARAEALAERLYGMMGCRGVARIDFIVEGGREPYLLEVNTVPGMTETSLVPKIAAARGIDFAQLCCLLLDRAALDSEAGNDARDVWG